MLLSTTPSELNNRGEQSAFPPFRVSSSLRVSLPFPFNSFVPFRAKLDTSIFPPVVLYPPAQFNITNVHLRGITRPLVPTERDQCFKGLTAELRIWRFVCSTLRNRFTLSCRRSGNFRNL
ncbi:MAG: hypothetical protein ACTS6A_02175 [Candidatus Hodgkinia cicadicola]